MCLDTFEVWLLMDLDMPLIVELCYLVMQTMTGDKLLWTERVPSATVLALVKL